jgi:hypothetical protein
MVKNPNPDTRGLKRDAGPGRPKGSKNKITRERWEKEVRFLAFSDPLQLFDRVAKGRRVFALREIDAMPEEIRRCIASVKVRTENLTAGDGEQDTTVEVKLWDKTKALELGARAMGWLKDHVVVEDLSTRKDRLRSALVRVNPKADE